MNMTKNFPWYKAYPQQVSYEINPSVYPSIMHLFDEAIRTYRNQKAYTNMGVNLTYERLDEMVGNFASFLQNELQLKKGDRIAIQMPNLLQFPVALFGALRAGLIVVNTNPLYTAKEMQHQFKDSGAKAIVILANYASLLEEIISKTDIETVIITEIGDFFPFPKNIIVNTVVKHVKKMIPKYSLSQSYSINKALQIGSEKPYTDVPLSHEDIAFLQYTGGTTGVSKGAVLTHKNIISNVMQIIEWMKPAVIPGEEIIVTALPMYHIFSLTLNCLTFMKYGGENILVTNPRDIPAFIKLHKTTPFSIMSGVNTLYNALMHHSEFKSINFSKLKISVAGATSLQKHVAEKWQTETGSRLFEGYGLTEASPVVCCNPVDGTHVTGTIGVPIPSTEVALMDDNNQIVAPGTPGELCVRGPQVMRGYWNRDDETKKVIIDGWLHTGDVAVMNENGFFKIVDRKKDMILVSGFNVYPNEVEEAIASHPGVLEVAVVGVSDDKSGEAVKAFVVKKQASLTSEEIMAHARKTLTNYKVPKYIEFKTELPKTNVGKILRRALREK